VADEGPVDEAAVSDAGIESDGEAQLEPSQRPAGADAGAGSEQAASGQPGASTGAPELPQTFLAVHRPDVVRLVWDPQKRDPAVAERLEPQPRDLEIVRALWRYEALLLTQIWQEWWEGKDIRAAQHRLKRLVMSGWLRRFRMRLAVGAHQPGFVLARQGFLAGQGHRGPHGSYIPNGVKWQEGRLAHHGALAHLLQTNAWVLAFRRLVGEHAVDWRGEQEGRLEVPTKLVEGRRVPIDVDDVELERYTRVRDLRDEQFERVWPDATVTMDMPRAGRTFDLMIELDRTDRPAKNFDKFRRYDALITSWWRRVERYRRMGEQPAAVFVCTDEAHAFAFMRAADREVTGRVARPGTAEQSWPYPGRERMLFVAERDVHEGSLRAWKLPAEPSAMIRRAELAPREVQLPGRKRGSG
jgi:hypothetical protein